MEKLSLAQRLSEGRKKLRHLYAGSSLYILMAAKLLVALACFVTINRAFPYQAFLTRWMVVLAIALLCSILPWNYIMVFAALWLLAQLIGLSLEAAAVVLVLLLSVAVLRYIILPGGGMLMAFLPVLCVCRIPYVAPLIMGLSGGIPGFVSVGIGVGAWYVLQFLAENSAYLQNTADSTMVQRTLFIVKGLMGDREMYYAMLCFALTTLVVYFISRLEVDYAHYIAPCVGAVLNPAMLYACCRFSGLTMKLGGLVLGSFAGLAAALIFAGFFRSLDYARAERVQFEDEDYFYYVKAVPKIKE